MGSVKCPGLAGKEPLRQVVGVPQVQVADLRPLDRTDPEEVASRHPERPRIARGNRHFVDLHRTAPCCVVKRHIGLGKTIVGIADHRPDGAPRRRIFWRPFVVVHRAPHCPNGTTLA